MRRVVLIIIVLSILSIVFVDSFVYHNDKTYALSGVCFGKYVENGIIYKLNRRDKTASVADVQNLTTRKIVIPEKVNGFTVTKIEDRAFGKPRCKKWKIILLPDSITEIGNRAFSTCLELKYIRLPKNLSTIGAECFFYCANLHDIAIPESVSYIGEEAFFSCVSLKKVNIPKNLKVLEKGLFKHCVSLNGFYIHENVKKIHNDVFSECGINLDLNKTVVDDCNPFYKKQDNFIIDRKNNLKVISFAIKNEEYKEKIEFANKLYAKMQVFLKKYKNCATEKFDDECLIFLKSISNPQKLLAKEEFEKNAKNKLILYRGVSRKEYADNFKSGKLFFATNLRNECGSGIYTTPEHRHAEIWIWSSNPDDYKVLEQYEHDNKLYEEMAYKLVPHGEVLKMYLDSTAKILDNSYLREVKDLIFKSHPSHFKDAVTFRDETFIDEKRKDLNVFKTKEDLLFHNSGLLTRLLGYDVLHEKETKAVIDENGALGSEYLIVNPEVLNVLNN